MINHSFVYSRMKCPHVLPSIHPSFRLSGQLSGLSTCALHDGRMSRRTSICSLAWVVRCPSGRASRSSDQLDRGRSRGLKIFFVGNSSCLTTEYFSELLNSAADCHRFDYCCGASLVHCRACAATRSGCERLDLNRRKYVNLHQRSETIHIISRHFTTG